MGVGSVMSVRWGRRDRPTSLLLGLTYRIRACREGEGGGERGRGSDSGFSRVTKLLTTS